MLLHVRVQVVHALTLLQTFQKKKGLKTQG